MPPNACVPAPSSESAAEPEMPPVRRAVSPAAGTSETASPDPSTSPISSLEKPYVWHVLLPLWLTILNVTVPSAPAT